MAEHGAKGVKSSRKKETCEEVAKAINAARGAGPPILIPGHISSNDGVKRLGNETNKAFGKVDVLVCNAASNPYFGPMAGIRDDQFRKILDNNIISSHCTLH